MQLDKVIKEVISGFKIGGVILAIASPFAMGCGGGGVLIVAPVIAMVIVIGATAVMFAIVNICGWVARIVKTRIRSCNVYEQRKTQSSLDRLVQQNPSTLEAEPERELVSGSCTR